MTLRHRLALALAIPPVLALSGGIALHWASVEVRLYCDRATQQFVGFAKLDELTRGADQYLRHAMQLLLGDARPDDEAAGLRQRLDEATAALRGFAAASVAVQDSGPPEPARVLLATLPRITAVLESLSYQLEHAEHLLARGQRADASALMSRVLTEEIQTRLDPAVDAALNAQRDHYVTLSGELVRRIERWKSWAFAAILATTALSALTARWVLRSLRRPLRALTLGTEAISAGNLAWRVPVADDPELGDLARHFNRMAQELERQHHALLEHQHVLEARVAERTNELNERNEELRRQDKFRRQFFADISHELKTPLTVMRGEAEVTLRGPDRPASEYRACLHRIRGSTIQLDRMVSELLLLARAEAGHLHFESQRLELNDLVASMVDELRALAQPVSIDVRWRPSPRALWIDADHSRFRQAILVLGDNACRYSPAGSELELSLEQWQDEAVLAVADRGIGIRPEEREKIFDRYYRSDNARQCRPDGTGLGLPVALAIVSAHRGRITADPRPGGGSVFRVIVPLAGPATEEGSA